MLLADEESADAVEEIIRAALSSPEFKPFPVRYDGHHYYFPTKNAEVKFTPEEVAKLKEYLGDWYYVTK